MRKGFKGFRAYLFRQLHEQSARAGGCRSTTPRAVPDTSEAAQQPAEATLSCKRQACSAAANAGGGAALAVSGSLRGATAQNIASVNRARTMTAKAGQGQAWLPCHAEKPYPAEVLLLVRLDGACLTQRRQQCSLDGRAAGVELHALQGSCPLRSGAACSSCTSCMPCRAAHSQLDYQLCIAAEGVG